MKAVSWALQMAALWAVLMAECWVVRWAVLREPCWVVHLDVQWAGYSAGPMVGCWERSKAACSVDLRESCSAAKMVALMVAQRAYLKAVWWVERLVDWMVEHSVAR